MTSTPIFARLVRSENDLSHVLVETMRRDDAVRVALLECFFPACNVESIRSTDIAREVVLKEHGRPDIVVRAPDFLGIVEVKDRANYQPTQLPDSPRGYVRYLEADPAKTKRLTYLERSEKATYKPQAAGNVVINTIFWAAIQNLLGSISPVGVWSHEFKMLLDHRFGEIFGSEGASKMLRTVADPETLELCKLIIKVVGELPQRKIEVEATKGEFGISYPNGNEKLIYFGYADWADPELGSSIIFATSDDYGPGRVSAFAKLWPDAKVVNEWVYVPIAQDALKGPMPEREVAKILVSVTDRLRLYMARENHAVHALLP